MSSPNASAAANGASARCTEMPLAERRKFWATNLNTCHVWAEDGEFVANLEAGRSRHFVPLFVKRRLTRLGRDPESWSSPLQG